MAVGGAGVGDIVTALEKLRKELTCSICKYLLTEPKTLPCLHSFCGHCLESHALLRPLDEEDPSDKRDVLPCPECRFRAPLILTPEGAAQREGGEGCMRAFKTNPCLKNLVDHLKLAHEVVGVSRREEVRSRCGFCSQRDNEAVAFCQNCNRFLCQVCCVQGHQRMTLTAGHHIVSLEEVRSKSDKDASPILVSHKTWKCKDHFNKGVDDPNERITDMIMYCKDCKKVICCLCALVDHQSHSKSFTKTVIDEEEHRPKIKGELTNTKETLDSVDRSCHMLYQRRVNIESARESTEAKINAQFVKLNAELEKQQETLLRNIDIIHKKHSHRLQIQREELDVRRKAIDRTLKFVERRLTLGTAEDIVYFKNDMIKRMTTLLQESKLPPPEVFRPREITFVKSDLDIAGAMGNVSAEPSIEICTADDLNRVPLVRNREIDFTITGRDVMNCITDIDEEMYLVELYPDVGDAAVREEDIITASVKREKNGKCRVTLTPRKMGMHYLSIKVAELGAFKAIKDSPYRVEIAIHPMHWLWEV